MHRVLLIGSGNRDKVGEMRVILAGLPWTAKGLTDFPSVPEPEEDGETFEANALAKARYYSEAFGVCCVADDSGLAVDALCGAPGVYSARYAGPGCAYEDNNRKLLRELQNTPFGSRTARFVCCAAFIDPAGAQHAERGEVEGTITTFPRGENGFGYDPVFMPDGFDRTFAEMTAEEKHAISHRGRAFRKLKDYLETLPCA